MSYTKGPWFVTGSMTLYVEARISGGLIQEVAAVGPTEADGGYGETQRANANLLAAAPELLEALEEFRQAFVIAVGDASPFAKFALGKVDAVIAKAKGEVK